MTFMTAVLGSTLFWIGYALAGFIFTLIYAKIKPYGDINLRGVRVLLTDTDKWHNSPASWDYRILAVLNVLSFIVFWPVTFLVYAFAGVFIVIGLALWWILSHMVKIAQPTIPTISVKLRKE
jgi:hypothetical protein